MEQQSSKVAYDRIKAKSQKFTLIGATTSNLIRGGKIPTIYHFVDFTTMHFFSYFFDDPTDAGSYRNNHKISSYFY